MLLIYNPKRSIRDASSGPFSKLDTMDAIWLTIMNNQLSCTVSLPPPAAHSGDHELLPRGVAVARGRLLNTLTKSRSEVNRVSCGDGEVMNASAQSPGSLSLQTH